MTERPPAQVIGPLARQTMKYEYELWGYGEAIGLEGLLAAASVLDRKPYFDFVKSLMSTWIADRSVINYADHVAPQAGPLSTCTSKRTILPSSSRPSVWRSFTPNSLARPKALLYIVPTTTNIPNTCTWTACMWTRPFSAALLR